MKALIVSHNPVSTYNGMGKTIRTFFSAFGREEVCQFYIYPSYPDVDACTSYYRVTDKEVLRSFFNLRAPGNPVPADKIGGDPALYENAEDEKVYTDKRNKRPFRILARDAMWFFSRWYNRKLKAWLEKEAPDCIFLAPGGAKFIYDVALKLARKRKIPIITYIADEYYFLEAEKGLLGKLQHRLIRRKMKKTLARSAHVITISREFEELYAKTFGRPTTTVMTGTRYIDRAVPEVKDRAQTVSYFGNIAYNRYVSLAEIGRALDEINAERHTDCCLEIYSAQKDEAAMRAFEGIASVRWMGFLSGEAFEEKFLSADLLLHTEAFDEKNIDLVKHSVSTKIADSLAVGIPLMAYGPDSISSMKHLIRHDCALVATSRETLKQTLETALFDREARQRVVQKARLAAACYHDDRKNSQLLREIITASVTEKSQGGGVEEERPSHE